MGLIFELALYLLIEIVADFILAVGWETASLSFRKEKEIPAPLAAIGIVFTGFICAWFYDLFVPDPILRLSPFPGISILISPIAVGGLTHLAGKWLRDRGRHSSHFMTFWGGALFAFVLAATRFFLLK